MKVKKLKEILKEFNDDSEVIITTGSDVPKLFYAEQCCNFDFQKKANELWLFFQLRKK